MMDGIGFMQIIWLKEETALSTVLGTNLELECSVLKKRIIRKEGLEEEEEEKEGNLKHENENIRAMDWEKC